MSINNYNDDLDHSILPMSGELAPPDDFEDHRKFNAGNDI